MGAQNGGQWQGLWRSGTPVKMQTWSLMGDAITDRPPGTGDHRPAVGRGRTISRHLGDLSCFLQRQTEAAAFAPLG